MLENDIPTTMLVKTNDIVSGHLSNYFDKSKNEQHYPLPSK